MISVSPSSPVLVSPSKSSTTSSGNRLEPLFMRRVIMRVASPTLPVEMTSSRAEEPKRFISSVKDPLPSAVVPFEAMGCDLT